MCPGATPEEYHFNVFGSVNQSAEIVPFPGAVALLQVLHKEYYFSVLGSVNQLKLSHFREQLALMQELHEEHYFSVFGSVNQSAEIVPFPGAAGAPARAPQGVLFQCFWFSKSVSWNWPISRSSWHYCKSSTRSIISVFSAQQVLSVSWICLVSRSSWHCCMSSTRSVTLTCSSSTLPTPTGRASCATTRRKCPAFCRMACQKSLWVDVFLVLFSPPPPPPPFFFSLCLCLCLTLWFSLLGYNSTR